MLDTAMLKEFLWKCLKGIPDRLFKITIVPIFWILVFCVFFVIWALSGVGGLVVLALEIVLFPVYCLIWLLSGFKLFGKMLNLYENNCRVK